MGDAVTPRNSDAKPDSIIFSDSDSDVEEKLPVFLSKNDNANFEELPWFPLSSTSTWKYLVTKEMAVDVAVVLP